MIQPDKVLLVTYRLGHWNAAFARALLSGNIHVWLSFGFVMALLVVMQIILISFG